jgi:hypothetical protein
MKRDYSMSARDPRQTTRSVLLLTAVASLGAAVAFGGGPLAAKVKVTPLKSYDGSNPLPKPERLIVYDFAIDTSAVQVDQSQKIRPRNVITGAEKPEVIARKASSKFSAELVKKLQATGIPVEHVAADVAQPENSLAIQGSFVSLKQGDKAQRVALGMGVGAAEVQTKVGVHLKTPGQAVLLSEFQTETTPAENVGAGVVSAVGVNPAAAVAKSTVTDRRKTIESLAKNTAGATAKEITKAMAAQGWIKLNDKGDVL